MSFFVLGPTALTGGVGILVPKNRAPGGDRGPSHRLALVPLPDLVKYMAENSSVLFEGLEELADFEAYRVLQMIGQMSPCRAPGQKANP